MMKMKSRLLFVSMVVAVMSTLIDVTTTTLNTTITTPRTTITTPTTTVTTPTTTITTPTTTRTTPTTTTGYTTTAYPGTNLNGKMFTLSRNGGGVSLYPASPAPTTYPPQTTPSPATGVSVCLRFLSEMPDYSKIFTLGRYSSSSMTLSSSSLGWFKLSWDSMGVVLMFKPSVMLWTDLRSDFWTGFCVTVDGMKRVAQVFSGSNMSIRKRLPLQYTLTGQPLIDISGFDGQVTDVQVWNYPVSYKEIRNYMSNSYYGYYHGNVLSWSNINFALSGDTLLEDTYQWQADEPIRRGARGRGQQEEREKLKLFYKQERGKERKNEQM